MTNDEINKLANEAMQSITVDDDEDYASGRGAIEYVIRQAVAAALEEAAKAPTRLIASMPEGTIFPVSKSLLKRVESEIRALIPASDGTKE